MESATLRTLPVSALMESRYDFVCSAGLLELISVGDPPRCVTVPVLWLASDPVCEGRDITSCPVLRVLAVASCPGRNVVARAKFE